MAQSAKPRLIGFNHVALEVGDIEEALAFYGRLFKFELRGKSATMAFIDLGDQFIALQKGRKQPADDGRHFGLVVDDKEAARAALNAAGLPRSRAHSLTSSTHGATALRSSAMTISSLRKPLTSCAAWV
jgi:catechol-2,3-dioxygenase